MIYAARTTRSGKLIVSFYYIDGITKTVNGSYIYTINGDFPKAGMNIARANITVADINGKITCTTQVRDLIVNFSKIVIWQFENLSALDTKDTIRAYIIGSASNPVELKFMLGDPSLKGFFDLQNRTWVSLAEAKLLVL